MNTEIKSEEKIINKTMNTMNTSVVKIEDNIKNIINDNSHMEDLCEKDIKNLINSTDKKTIPFLSKFEKTKALGLRIQQLCTGSKTTLSIKEQKYLKSNIEIAEKELKLKKMPFIIKRRLPNNKSEYWHIRDLTDLNE